MHALGKTKPPSASGGSLGEITNLANYLLDHAHPTRIYSSQPFLGGSYQNKLMRSNNFEVNVPVIMCIEVEAQANNCENKAYL